MSYVYAQNVRELLNTTRYVANHLIFPPRTLMSLKKGDHCKMNVLNSKVSIFLDCILVSARLFRENGFVRKGRENGVGGGLVLDVDVDETTTKKKENQKKDTNNHEEDEYEEEEADDGEIEEIDVKCSKRIAPSESLMDLEKLQQQ
jgi:hypothetical protein